MIDSDTQKKSVKTEKGEIFYFFKKISDTAPTVVLLHGLSANHTTWQVAIQSLSTAGLNCLAPDLRGHGYSDKSKKRRYYKYSVFSEDLEQIVQAEKLSKIILVGYSFGGFLALDFAVRNPQAVSILILISANHVNPLKYKKINFLTWPGYFLLNLVARLLIWQKRKNYYYFDQAASHGYWDSSLKGYTTMPLSINFWMLSETARLDFSVQIKNLDCPTLIIKSKADPFLSDKEASDMAGKIKNSKIAILEEPTHFLASRHQEKIAGIMVDFIKEQKLYAG